MADHHRARLGAERGGRVEDVVDHRGAGHLVEHLRAGRLHPRALAGGKDQDVGGGHPPIEAQIPRSCMLTTLITGCIL